MRRAAAFAMACALLSAAAGTQAAVRKVTVAVVSLADDPRYAGRRLELGYPGHPQGRALEGVRLAAQDAAFELAAENVELVVRDVVLPGPGALPAALAGLKTLRVQHVVADLPLPELEELVRQAPAALGGSMVFNTGLDDDGLRAGGCAAHLLHTLPSRSMASDAIAQYLAARNWRKVLLLQGPRPADALLGEAFVRSSKRYGLKLVQTRPFRLSGDPRERDMANVRLLTSDREHDVVAVMDSDGEFARTVPYATQLPRPVVGAAGLAALAWHPQWERHGGVQLSRRFLRLARRPMQAHDWAAWMAAKAIVSVLADDPGADIGQQLRKLRGGRVFIDGFKGQRLSFRAWDGQLRQPLLLAHGDGVAGVAPLDGVLHSREVLDTLGVDEPESACKQRS